MEESTDERTRFVGGDDARQFSANSHQNRPNRSSVPEPLVPMNPMPCETSAVGLTVAQAQGVMSRATQKGFSVADMMTAICLAGIVSIMTFPVVSSLSSQYDLASATNQVAFEISRARMQAVGQNVFVRLRLAEGRLVRERSADGVTFTQDGPLSTLPQNVSVSVGANGAPIFDRSGLAPATTVITLNNSRGQMTIQTSVLGRVTIS